jgi:hypothetical protein
VVLRAPKQQLTWDFGWSDDDALAFFFPHTGQALVVPRPFAGDFFVREKWFELRAADRVKCARLIALSARRHIIPVAPGCGSGARSSLKAGLLLFAEHAAKTRVF